MEYIYSIFYSSAISLYNLRLKEALGHNDWLSKCLNYLSTFKKSNLKIFFSLYQNSEWFVFHKDQNGFAKLDGF